MNSFLDNIRHETLSSIPTYMQNDLETKLISENEQIKQKSPFRKNVKFKTLYQFSKYEIYIYISPCVLLMGDY